MRKHVGGAQREKSSEREDRSYGLVVAAYKCLEGEGEKKGE